MAQEMGFAQCLEELELLPKFMAKGSVLLHC